MSSEMKAEKFYKTQEIKNMNIALSLAYVKGIYDLFIFSLDSWVIFLLVWKIFVPLVFIYLRLVNLAFCL